MSAPSLIRRDPTVLHADPRRVLARPFLPGQELVGPGVSRADAVVQRLLDLPEDAVRTTLAATLERYAHRHRDLRATFAGHFALVAARVPDPAALSAEHRELIGAYFTHEYSIESAALFNPSIVAHPDQTGLAAGELRFVMSLRAVGEGHISSIEFRTGVLDRSAAVRLDDPGRYVVGGTVEPRSSDPDAYRLRFPAGSPLSELVLHPQVPAEAQGLEDARFTRFTDEDGSSVYLATYTAFDGTNIAPHLLRTRDFRSFEVGRLDGPAATNKGMAIFPRRVGGRYLALSRWDRENNSITGSTDARRWDEAVTIQTPRRPWELIQLGNCGPPIETDAGWLVLTHGVGPLRTYSIGALLLDRDEPTRVLGALEEPLLHPDNQEREGYVPNVLYSCGALVHEQTLLIPYGCSDSAVRFARADLPALLERMRRPG